MKEPKMNNIDVEINPEQPLFVITVVSNMVDLPIWTLRRLDDMGVITPKRIGKKTRCYSMSQVKKLIYIHHLMEERHVNISGIKVILEINKQ